MDGYGIAEAGCVPQKMRAGTSPPKRCPSRITAIQLKHSRYAGHVGPVSRQRVKFRYHRVFVTDQDPRKLTRRDVSEISATKQNKKKQTFSRTLPPFSLPQNTHAYKHQELSWNISSCFRKSFNHTVGCNFLQRKTSSYQRGADQMEVVEVRGHLNSMRQTVLGGTRWLWLI
jgi:hypothetical protein